MEPNLTLPFDESHAFIIGINDYSNGVEPLETAVQDARDMVELFKGHDYKVPKENIKLNATKADMVKLFARMKDKEVVKAEDRVIFYFAGHGIAFDSEVDPQGYLVPADASNKDKSSLLPMDTLRETLEAMDCKHVLLILDCCFAGSFKWSTGSRSFTFDENDILYAERVLRFAKHKAWQVITSSAHDQKAADILNDQVIGVRDQKGSKIHGNSPFAHALKLAIGEGEADVVRNNKSDGIITATELYAYMRDWVETETRKNGTGQSPAFFTLKNHDTKGEFIFFNPKSELNLPPAPDYNPYKGLQVFQHTPDDIKHFFGRDAAIQEMETRLKNTPLLVVSAPSGLGKSSAVKAGLFPILKKSDQFQFLHSIRPSDGAKAINDLLDGLNMSESHLFLIDQFEELFHMEKEAREDFEKGLEEIYKLTQAEPMTIMKMILTIRSDFEWHLRDSAFGQRFWKEEQITKFLYRLPPMKREELEEVMRKPANLIAYDFESDLMVDQILAEIDNAPGALPLLSFTLNKLYEFRDQDNRQFRLNDYTQKLGGINGALSTIADQVFDSFQPEASKKKTNGPSIADNSSQKKVLQDKQAILRNLFLRMVRLNDGSYTRRRVYLRKPSNILTEKELNELDYPDHLDEMVEEVLEAIGGGKIQDDSKKLKAQLVMRDQDELGPFIEPIHDSLLNFWGKCLNWIQDFGREHLVLQRQLWQAVEEHHAYDPYNVVDYGNELNTGGAPLWHNNPKLELVLMAICDPHKEWLCKKGYSEVNISTVAWLLWDDEPDEQQLASLQPFVGIEPFIEYDLPTLFKKIQAQMDPWLNEFELAFIKESFTKQKMELERLRKERDEALRLAREARASAMAARARQLEQIDTVKAINLAAAAYRYYPSADTAEAWGAVASNPQNGWRRKTLLCPEPAGSLAFSPDDKYLLAKGNNEKALLWDLEKDHIDIELDGHEYYVRALDYHPSKNLVAVAGNIGSPKLWNLNEQVTNGKSSFFQEFSSEEYSSYVYSLAFSPSGKLLAVGMEWGVIVFETGTAKLKNHYLDDARDIWGIAFTPDELCLAFPTSDFKIRLWDIHSGKIKKTYTGHQDTITSIAISPDGKYLLSGDTEQFIQLRELRNGKLLQSFKETKRGGVQLAFMPDGKSYISACGNRAHMRDIKTGEVLKQFLEEGRFELSMEGISISSNGKLFATAGEHKRIQIWDLEAGKEIEKTFLGEHLGGGADFGDQRFGTPEKQTIFFNYYHQLHSLQVDPSNELGAFLAEFSVGIFFAKNGNFLISRDSIDTPIKLWEVASGKVIQSLEPKKNEYIWLCQISEYGDFVAINHNPRHQQVEIEKSYIELFKKMGDGTVSPVQTFEAFPGTASFMQIASNGSFIIADGPENTINYWETASGKAIRTYKGHTNSLCQLALSPNGRQFASASYDLSIKIWDFDTEEPVKSLDLPTLGNHRGNRSISMCFSSDGNFLLAGIRNGFAVLWDIHAGKPIRTYYGHDGTVGRVGFSEDEKFVLTVSDDGHLRKWYNPLKQWDPRIYKLNREERKELGIPEEVEY